MRVTIKTIARALDVSPATVSNAYNRPDQLSASLRDRILAKAEELGYDGPNAAAQTLRSGKAHAIGLATGYSLQYAFSDPFAIGFLAGLSEACHANGAALSLLPLSTTGSSDLDLSSLKRANIDGLTEICLRNIHEVRTLAHRRNIPFIGTYVDPDMDYVAIDDAQTGRLLGEHLHRLGHRRVAVIMDSARAIGAPAGPVTEFDAGAWDTDRVDPMWSERFRGLIESMPDTEFVAVASGLNSIESGRVAGSYVLDSANRPTAIACVSDVLALGVLEALTERGLSAPADVSVCGIDDVDAAQRVGLTTIHQPVTERGRMIGELLFDPTIVQRQVVLPVSLVVRRTTGPAPRQGLSTH